MEVSACPELRQETFVELSPGGEVVLQCSLGWSEVHKATHYCIHQGGLAGGHSFLEGMEVQPVDEFCGAGGLTTIMEHSSRSGAALDSFNCFMRYC